MTKKFYNNGGFTIESTNEIIIPNTGLGLIGKILANTSLAQKIDRLTTPGANVKAKNSDCVLSYIGLLCQGTNSFEEIDSHKENPSYGYLLQTKKIPSKETLRQRFDLLGKLGTYKPIIWETLIQAMQATQSAIPVIDGVSLKEKKQEGEKIIETKRWLELSQPIVPVDLDVSPFDNSDSKKEGVSRTYKGVDGYSPNFMYLSTEGYLINIDLRMGKTHVQKGTPDFINQGLKHAKQITSQKLCLRMDSGNDSLDNLQICQNNEVDYVIKRNLRQEDPADYLRLAQQCQAEEISERAGKSHYDFIREVQRVDGKYYKQANRVTVREIDKEDQILMFPEIEVESYWTTLEDPVETIIALYHNHAICEQFHSEIKDDLDSERLPSGKFATNQLVLHLTALAYNLLRMVGQRHLDGSGGKSKKKHVSRIRMKTILKHILFIASKVVTTGRKTVLKISKYTKELFSFHWLNENLIRE